MITDPYACLDNNRFQAGASAAGLLIPWLTGKSFRTLTGSPRSWFNDGYCLSPGADPLFHVLTTTADTDGAREGEPVQCGGTPRPSKPAARLAQALTRRAEPTDMEQRCELLLTPQSMEQWGLESGWSARYMGEQYQPQVVFGSPALDVAATPERAAETVELGEVLLRLTHFQIRLLSGSPEVAYNVARGLHHRLPGASKSRVIFGLAIGGFEGEASQSSKYSPNATEQIGALNWLQDHGFRTFCLLGEVKSNGASNVQNILRRIRAERCEDVWACVA
jgi:hypothetical protein